MPQTANDAGAARLPAPPRYGSASLGEVLPSAAAVLGVPGYANTLGLPPARRVCVVMADGLGSALLKSRGGHAPFLRRHLETGRHLDAAFPTTTAASLATLGTGLPPGRHGIVGYDVLDPAGPRVVNMLGGWPSDLDPAAWQPHRTVLEDAAGHVHVATVSLPQFDGSSLTRAALRGGEFAAAKTAQARVRRASEILAAHERVLMYCYWNELDKAGHRHGSASLEWGEQLEELDAAMRTLAARLPAGTLLLLTADHGMVDVPERHRIDYSLTPELVDGVALTAGEPRCVQLHVEPGLSAGGRERLVGAWRAALGPRAWILERHEAVAHGFFGDVDADVLPRIGDLLVLPSVPELALYDGRRVAPRAFEMVGQHGSVTRAERVVPLLTLARTG
ncbi:nucleotide pyrophosphatase/phosphodiesterase family protein [Zafaria sp. J156]|uniref:alkaline phosphatase family protein n=1 Tax=Zafaria sp. J156 TaxID=3116490 RepID=UPI002E77C2D0|nr:nucleotide pyrophosphatase/phosphodiesterase family protein [Zafaria sp. J156]MEE1620240.1 alkaline phosphatase family protein [Zafaria sp. J156]